MPLSTTLKNYARIALRRTPSRVKRRIPVPLRRRIGRLLDPSARSRQPLLSVIIPVYNVEPYLATCLTSVLNQSLRSLEVLIVDDGSTDRSPKIIAEFARSDPRIRTFKQTNAGQGPARNMAVSHARGQFIAFLDADDIVPPGAYRYMVKSLQASGSDFSVGSVARLKNGRLAKTAWTEPVHRRDQIGITIDDFPTALLDVIACNRMFRREFWVEKVGGFPEGILYEDHLPMVKAYVRAQAFDLLAKVTYHWRIREDMSSTGQQKHILANLSDRIIVKKDAYQVLQSEASPKVLSAWVGRVLDTDFPPYIEHALTADEEYRIMLRDVFAQYRAIADEEAMSQVRVQQKILGYLVSKNRWDELEIVRRHFESGGYLSRTVIRSDRVYLNLSKTALESLDLPLDVCELGSRETSVISCLSSAVWCDSRQLKLTGWSYIRNVDLGTRAPLTTAWLLDLESRRRVDLVLKQWTTPEATRWSGQFHACVDNAGFEIDLDLGELSSPDDKMERTWQLNLEVAFDGLVRQGRIHQALIGSPLGTGALAHTIDDSGRQAVLDFDPAAGLTLTLRQPKITTVRLGELEKRTVAGQLRAADLGTEQLVTVEAVERSTKEIAEALLRHGSGEGTHSFTLKLPNLEETSVSGAEWDLRVATDSGKTHPLEWPPELAAHRVPTGQSGMAYWQRIRTGAVRLVVDRPDVAVAAAGATDAVISITLSGPGLQTALGSCSLKSARLEITAIRHERCTDGTVVYFFPIRASEFNLPPVALPSGTYDVIFSDGLGRSHKVSAAPDFASELPFYASTVVHRAKFVTTKQSPFGVNLQAPLTTEEISNYGSARLRDHYRQQLGDPEASVLFQCYLGETATDSQSALHEGLRSERPDLTLHWGVRDLATRIPEGGVPLIIGSRSWYEQLAAARYLCHNIDFPGFFAKRPHQRFLQTFHGYPFKSMGRTFWRQRRYSPQRIAYECARRNAEWDAILVPSEFCVEFYRQEYDYTGDVLVTGYPRSDVLVNEEAAQIRRRTRERLGLTDDQTAILYAPTYRDVLTTRTFAAKRFDELDLELLTKRLDDSYVILIRGHNNNQRESSRVTGFHRVVDVTDYPEINDLTLAADVALLDYSSLRFDWALTEKPMIFFVPDIDTYFAERPPLFDFSSTAPGPLLRSTDDVADALSNLDGVKLEYAGTISDFNKAFNELHDGRATRRVIDAFFRS